MLWGEGTLPRKSGRMTLGLVFLCGMRVKLTASSWDWKLVFGMRAGQGTVVFCIYDNKSRATLLWPCERSRIVASVRLCLN